MKPLYLLSVIYVTLIVSSCSTPVSHQVMMPDSETTMTPPCSAHKDPTRISMVSTQAVKSHPYKVVATAKVSKYNLVGIKRQEATIRDIMRELAASANGDALIDIQNHEKEITATVITYNDALA